VLTVQTENGTHDVDKNGTHVISSECVVSGNIRLSRIFAGVPWGPDVKRQWGNRKRRFSGFHTLRFRHLTKWGQHYYIVLFSPLSPFHRSQNIWPWMPIYVKFPLLRAARFQNLFYIPTVEPIYRIFFVVSRHQQKCAEADRDPQNIWDPRKDCGSFVDEKLRALHRWNLNK